MDLLAEQFRRAHRYDPRAEPVCAQRLRRHAEAIKIKLSAPGRNEVRTAILLGAHTLEVVLTRTEFEQLTGPHIERSLTVCEKLLQAAGLDWQALDGVLLAGGASLVPAVAEALRQVSGKPAEQVQRRQPHMAIAYGAALLAADRASVPTGGALQDRNSKYEIRNLAGAALGLRVINPATRRPEVEIVIPQNTPVPVRRSTIYHSNRAGQTRMVFEVVQVKQIDEPVSLGHFAFPLENPRPLHKLEVTLGYDAHGLVTVDARDAGTGREVRREFGGSESQGADEMRAQAELLASVRLNE
jgi:molecular chaperone DnaK